MAEKLFNDVSMPRDANGRPAAVVFGYDPATDIFYPLAVENVGDGTYKLKVAASFSGSITIGKVTLKSGSSDDVADVSTDKKVLAKADDDPMYKKNITTDFTYIGVGLPGAGKVATMKEYPSGSAGGAAAKLTTFSYNADSQVTKMAVTDTTV